MISKKVRRDFSAIPVHEKWTMPEQTPHFTRNELSTISLRHDMQLLRRLGNDFIIRTTHIVLSISAIIAASRNATDSAFGITVI